MIFIMFILLVLALIASTILVYRLTNVNHDLRTTLHAQNAEMRELERVSNEDYEDVRAQLQHRDRYISELTEKAEENNAAWQQGIDDQQECYEQEYLSLNETIAGLNAALEYEQERHTSALAMVVELEELHQFHQDHCLPVLQHMRQALRHPILVEAESLGGHANGN